MLTIPSSRVRLISNTDLYWFASGFINTVLPLITFVGNNFIFLEDVMSQYMGWLWHQGHIWHIVCTFCASSHLRHLSNCCCTVWNPVDTVLHYPFKTRQIQSHALKGNKQITWPHLWPTPLWHHIFAYSKTMLSFQVRKWVLSWLDLSCKSLLIVLKVPIRCPFVIYLLR